MNKHLFLISAIISLLLFQQCKDNSVTPAGDSVLFYKDSIYHKLYDTVLMIYPPFVHPFKEGKTVSNLLLEYDGDTNLDSINAVPYMSIYLKVNNVKKYWFLSYSKTEINGHHRVIINTGATGMGPGLPYALFIHTSVIRPHVIGFKYVGLKNVRLSLHY